jgi:hypothetical protein
MISTVVVNLEEYLTFTCVEDGITSVSECGGGDVSILEDGGVCRANFENNLVFSVDTSLIGVISSDE